VSIGSIFYNAETWQVFLIDSDHSSRRAFWTPCFGRRPASVEDSLEISVHVLAIVETDLVVDVLAAVCTCDVDSPPSFAHSFALIDRDPVFYHALPYSGRLGYTSALPNLKARSRQLLTSSSPASIASPLLLSRTFRYAISNASIRGSQTKLSVHPLFRWVFRVEV
jgi:hypothetical protein